MPSYAFARLRPALYIMRGRNRYQPARKDFHSLDVRFEPPPLISRLSAVPCLGSHFDHNLVISCAVMLVCRFLGEDAFCPSRCIPGVGVFLNRGSIAVWGESSSSVVGVVSLFALSARQRTECWPGSCSDSHGHQSRQCMTWLLPG